MPNISIGLTFKDGKIVDPVETNEVFEIDKNGHIENKNINIFPEIDKNKIVKSYCSSRNKFSIEELERTFNRVNLKIASTWDDKITFEVEQIEKYLMENLSEYHLNPSLENSKKIKEYIFFLFSNNFLLNAGGSEPRDSTQDIRDFLINILYSYSVLERNGHLLDEDKDIFKKNIDKRIKVFKRIDNDRFTALGCKKNSSVFNCQNHTYQYQHLKGLYGFLFDKESFIKDSEKLYKFAIEDLKEDGALWREASRSKWAWTYYPHALSHLLAIAEIHFLNGNNIYEFKSEKNHTIHDAVSFYLRSIENNELMWKYSKSLAGVQHYEDYKNYQDPYYFSFSLNSLKDGYQKWLYIYLHRFPDHQNSKIARKLIKTWEAKIVWSYHIGFNPQCFYHNNNLSINDNKANNLEGEHTIKWYWKVLKNDEIIQNLYLGEDQIEIIENINFTKFGNFKEISKKNRSQIEIEIGLNNFYINGNLDLASDNDTSEVNLKGIIIPNDNGDFEAEGVWGIRDTGEIELIRVILTKNKDNKSLLEDLDLSINKK